MKNMGWREIDVPLRKVDARSDKLPAHPIDSYIVFLADRMELRALIASK